jgi:hypothetical protein
MGTYCLIIFPIGILLKLKGLLSFKLQKQVSAALDKKMWLIHIHGVHLVKKCLREAIIK